LGSGPSAQGSSELNPRFLLDTHVAVRWLAAPKKLSREQTRVLRDSVRRQEPVAISAITLLEIAVLFGEGRTRSDLPLDKLLEELDSNPAFQILPLTVDVATEVAALGRFLRDPADRTIVATARVRRLRLVTSDQRIIDSGLCAGYRIGSIWAHPSTRVSRGAFYR
jgi:PIN domain nuclease of toxin-antitoxin system